MLKKMIINLQNINSSIFPKISAPFTRHTVLATLNSSGKFFPVRLERRENSMNELTIKSGLDRLDQLYILSLNKEQFQLKLSNNAFKELPHLLSMNNLKAFSLKENHLIDLKNYKRLPKWIEVLDFRYMNS